MATHTSNYAWTKPEGGDPVDIGVLNNNLDSQDNIVHNAYMQLAPVFSSASTYAVDDVVLYSNNLYKCHTAVTVAGDWTGATNWTQVKVSDICGDGGTSDYTPLSNKPSVNNVTLVGNKTGTQLGLQNTGEASIGVEELIRDTVGRVGKNLMVYPYYEGTEEEQGVTFTDNGDGTITLSGTSSASAYHFLERDSSLYLKAGDYILGGGILNAWLYLYTNSGTEIAHTNNSDTSVKVTIPSDGYYRVSLVILANKTFSNVTCYPMIRHAEVVDDTYESYYPPIEDELEKLKIQLSVMPTASATYVGKIVQFVGTTDANYTHGYIYECTTDGSTYAWTQLNVQPSSGGGGGTSDYTDLTNKPQINGVTLTGNKSTSDLGINAAGVGLGNVPNVATDDQTPTFTTAQSRNNIVSGEKISVMLGKISKFFNDLKTVAFTGSYSDLSDKPQVKQAASGGTDESLVTTGEKYIWGQTATSSVQGRVYIDYNYKNTAALNYDDIALSMTGARMLYAEVRAVFVSGVLATGSTSITLEFTDINRVFDYSSQFSDVLVDIYTDVPGLTYESITETITQVTEPGPSGPQTSNKLSVTLTFEAQSSAVNVTMRLSKKGA